MLKLALASALTLALSTHAFAFDNGQYGSADPATKNWFKAQRSPKSGISCCDIADGHRTLWRTDSDGNYEVPIDSVWVKVPPDVIITSPDNPTGEAVVWYEKFENGGVFVRCFVVGNGV